MKLGWVAMGTIALAGLMPSACDRNPAEPGTYDWIDGGEAGAASAGTGATQGGAGGMTSIGGKGSGVGGRSSGDAGATSSAGSDQPSAGASGRGGGTGGAEPGPRGGSSGAGGRDEGEGGEGGDAGNAVEHGGALGVAPDPCATASDTDEDGVTDPCDDDDDDDGYLDADDVSPTDPFAPGGIVAPGTIVNDACIKGVLAELALLGMTMPIHRQLFPPEMSGYYVRGAEQGTILAGNDGVAIGARTTGMEARVVVTSVGRFDSAVVDFWAGQALSYGIGHGAWLRGRGSDFTHFGSGGGFVLMYSATRGGSGSWIDGHYLSILLPTSGIPHTECPVGAGKYRFSNAPLTAKVEPSELDFMCVDDDAAYVPTERWSRDGGELCECTSTYQVSCDDP